MLLLRVPNQICVATKEFHGVLSVGTLMGAAGCFLRIYRISSILKKNKNKKFKLLIFNKLIQI